MQASIEKNLSQYSLKSKSSRGRVYKEPKHEIRTEFQRDRERIIHTTAFRRLEYKTQVFVNHEGDHYRTRLTHTIEVAQIARAIARSLNINEDLTEAIALAHDLGHTPFGHAGQDALNICMKLDGGFEHNIQSLRIVDKLEKRYASFPGLNLCFETREGILKKCTKKLAKELGEVGNRFIDGKSPSLEAQVTNIADEIAYNNHDIDDGIRSKKISLEQLETLEIFKIQKNNILNKYPKIKKSLLLGELIKSTINLLIIDLIKNTLDSIKMNKVENSEDVKNFKKLLVDFSPEIKKDNIQLKRFLNKKLYQHEDVKKMTNQANKIISELFNAYDSDINLLPKDYIKHNEKSLNGGQKRRKIADFISGMTDRYAINEHKKLFK